MRTVRRRAITKAHGYKMKNVSSSFYRRTFVIKITPDRTLLFNDRTHGQKFIDFLNRSIKYYKDKGVI